MNNVPLISSKPFVSCNHDRPSLSDFRTSINAHTLTLSQMRQTLQEASRPFASARGVAPFQCRKAVELLIALKSDIRRYSQFLRETQTMPVVVVALRYPLLDKLHALEEQLDRILSYLYEMLSPPHTLALRQYVSQLFEDLFLSIAGVPQQVSSLFDEARFQEKRILPLEG